MTLKFFDDGSGKSYTAMGVPGQLSTSNVTSSSADLTLPTGVTGAQYYELTESTNNGASWTVVDSAIAPSSIVSPATYSRSGLTSGATYQWRLRAKFASLISPVYSAVRITKIVSIAPTSLSLTGAGFGAVSNPAPSAYDTFSNDVYPGVASGDTFPTTYNTLPNARWDHTNNNDGATFDGSIKLPGRDFSMSPNSNGAALYSLLPSSSGPARENLSIYWSAWLYLNESPYGAAMSAQDGGSSTSFKFARCWNAPASLGHTGNVFNRFSWLFRDDNGTGTSAQIYGMDVSNKYSNAVPSIVYIANADSFFVPNKWIRIEFEIFNVVLNSSGDYIGTLNLRINGKKVTAVNSSVGFSSTEIPVYVTPDANGIYHPFQTSMVGSDPSISSNITPTFRCRVAEVYEQPTRERVEFSNNASFNDTIQSDRFYQMVSSRSDTQITIPSPFYGTLDQTKPIYAHIIKADGSVAEYGAIN